MDIRTLTAQEVELINRSLPAFMRARLGSLLDAAFDLLLATPGTAKASSAAILGATKNLDELLVTKLAIGKSTPVNAVASSATLTFDDVVVDGETVTIGDDVYEFAADDAQSVTTGNLAVDITANTTASQGTLTVDTQPTAGNTMTIGTKEYTFVADGTEEADGEISVGTNLPTAQAAIVAAINGTDGVNTAHPLVSAAAFETNACVITALVGGTDGDDIATTESFTAETNIFNAVKLGTTRAGADCTGANAITALVAAITANEDSVVTAADGDGDTMVATAKVKGVSGDLIGVETDCANASWGVDVTTLDNGVNGTVGVEGQVTFDATNVYLCTVANTIADANWKKIALASL